MPQVARSEDELAAVLGRSADSVVTKCWGQQMSDTRGVVSGSQHGQDVRGARLPLAGGDEPFDDLADLVHVHEGISQDALIPRTDNHGLRAVPPPL